MSTATATRAPGGTGNLLPLARSIAQRVAGAVGTLLVATFLIFAALSATPGDPAAQIAGPRATEAQRAAVSHQLGLDRPFPVRFVDWLGGAVHGDFGRSITYRQNVSGLIGPRIGTTVLLIALATVLIVAIGIAVGALGGMKEGLRPLVSGLVGVGISIPAFVSSSVLIAVFAVRLGWFPSYGAGSGLIDRLHHLLLPAVALSLGWTAYVAQMTMAAVRDQATREHVMTAVGRGLDRRVVFRRHILRNAAIPVMTASGLTVAGLVAGTVVVETSFGIDGLGSLLVTSVLNKDYPTVLAVSVLIVVVFVVVTTAIDLVQLGLDPRLRSPRGGRR